VNRIDPNTLTWVKSEIDDTLTLAQNSLEAYVEDSADESQLRFCTNYLHQVHGTLQMVELYGAALAIEEMEKLSQAIFDDSVNNKDDAYETLMRGILQMPDYLEHLLAGNPEMPVVLLPLLNDMRAARNEHLLSEGALFTPDLNVAPPVFESNTESKADLSETAKALRHKFHLGLLDWFKDKNSKAGLQKISDVFTALTQAAESDAARRVFWIAKGLVESLKDKGVDSSAAVKMLMGQVDRQVKKLIDDGATALDKEPVEDLEKNLLYYVASSSTDGEVTASIKQAFKLKEIMPDTQTLEQARANLGAPNAALMETVSSVIIEDINKVKDSLDVFVRADDKDLSVLEDVHASLIQMADTLAMLNLGEQQDAVIKQAEVVNAMAGGNELDDSALLGVADAMLAVEKSLSEISTAKTVVADEENNDLAGDMPEAEHKILMRAVLAEAKINLSKVKNALTEFSVNPESSEQLKTIPDLLVQIYGSLNILTLEHAAKLLAHTNSYIADNLIKNISASQDDMNNLADAISSLEYYMESLSGDWGKPEEILDIAEQSLQALGIATNEPLAVASDVVEDKDTATEHQVENAIPTDDLSITLSDTDESSSDDTGFDEFTLDDSAGDTLEDELVSDEKTINSETVVEVDFSQDDKSSVEANLLDDTIDDEIIEIFMEEADEAYELISKLLPLWLDNTSDDSALKEIRRAYHTLKGSGRLVGAAELGEFAWAFENMLNRVIDNTVNIGPEIIELMPKGKEALPELFELFKTKSKAGEDILILMQHADALSKGEPITADVTDESFPIDIDPALLDIYRKEVATHCETLRQYIEAWNADEKEVSAALLRALHTLTGSSRTTGVQSLAQVCSSFEKYAKQLEEMTVELPDVALSELEQIVLLINNTVECLDVAGATLPEHETLLSRIEALPTDFEKVVAIPVTETTEASNDEPVSGYDEELLEIFLEEALEIIDESDRIIHEWIEKPDDSEFVKELQRQLHTLKGGARMAGVTELGDLGHSMESLLTMVVDDNLLPSKLMFDLVVRTQDRLVKMLESIQTNKPLEPASDLIELVNTMLARKSVDAESETPEAEDKPDKTDIDEVEAFDGEIEDKAEEVIEDELSTIAVSELEELEEELRLDLEKLSIEKIESSPLDSEEVTSLTDNDSGIVAEQESTVIEESSEAQVAVEDENERRSISRGQTEQVRVRADLLDNLVNFAGEVSIYRSRLEQQTNNFRYNITEFDETVNRLREQLRQFEIETETQIEYKNEELSSAQENFDPLEMDRFTTMQHLSRAMMESLSDLDSLRGILNNLTRESETLLLQQSRVNTDLQEGLMRTRMVPFSGHAGRLRRIVRQTCDELGKQANLKLEGVEAELDRSVLERIISPIEHMLRNAVAHGIEAPQDRKQAGKSEAGNIHFSILNEGSDILIKIKDDGAGIDLEAIRNKAVDKGLIEKGANVGKEKLLNMIMQSGFSTADSVSQISGRGVGMDVVNTEIKQLGGVFNIDTEDNKGTTFTITLPLTLAISRALMVMVGEDTYAVPLLSVKGIERVSATKLKEIAASDEKTYEWADEDYQFMHLGAVMGNNEITINDEGQQLPLLMVRSGDYRAAILVDTLLGSREIVVKSVGPQLSTLRGISGATVMGDGSVVLILDLAMLVRLVTTTDELSSDISAAITEDIIDTSLPNVMVVDDSITVRKVTSRLLERHNMNVFSAKDGVDALSQLQESIPDIMLLDVEMPRMDGFELATNIRNDDRLKDIPIIMITSRTGQKHRDRAEAIGVNIYMGKPFTETDLIENIDTLIGLDA